MFVIFNLLKRRIFKSLLIFLLCLFTTLTCHSDEFHQWKFDGISDIETPKLVTQHSNGDVFVVTDNAIYVIIGNTAKHLKLPKNSIQPFNIINYFYDSSDRLYFWSWYGIIYYDIDSGQLNTVELDLHKNGIVSQIASQNGFVYLEHLQGIFKYTFPNKLEKIYDGQLAKSSKYVHRSFSIDTKGNLVVLNEAGELIRVVDAAIEFISSTTIFENVRIKQSKIVDDKLFVTTDNGLYLFKFDDNTWSKLNVSSHFQEFDHIRLIDNNLLLPSNNSVVKIDTKAPFTSEIISISGNPSTINDALIDNDGMLWVLTKQKSILLKSKYIKRAFNNKESLIKSGLQYGTLHTFSYIQGHFYLGTSNGLYKLDKNKQLKLLFKSKPLTSKLILDEKIYFGSTEAIYELNTDTDQTERYSFSTTYKDKSLYSRSLALGKDQNIWIWNDNAGIAVFNSQSGNFQIPNESFLQFASKITETSYLAFSADKRKLLLSQETGAFSFNLDDASFKRFFYPIPIDTQKINHGNLAGRNVYNFSTLNDQTILFYDVDKIAVYDEIADTFINKDIGIENARCIASFKDEYFAVNKVGELITGNDDSIKENSNYAIPNSKINYRECILDEENGFFYLLSLNGIISVPLSPSPLNDRSPEIHLGELKLNDKVTKISSVSLSYDEYSLAVEVHSDSFIHPLLQKIKYQLVGFHERPIIENYTGKVNVHGISDGYYHLYISVSNADGVWSDWKPYLSFNVKDPIWRTVPAILLYIIGTITCILIFYRQRVRTVVNKNKELQLLVAEQTSELKGLLSFKNHFILDLTHEFKSMLQIQENEFEFIDTAKNESDGFDVGRLSDSNKSMMRIIDQLLNLASLQSSKLLELEHFNAGSMLKLTVPLFDHLAQKLGITIELDITLPNLVIYGHRNSFERIFSNLIGNAIKYNRKNGFVKIQASIENNRVIIKVADSGYGIPNYKLPKNITYYGAASEEAVLEHKMVSHGVGLKLVKKAIEINKGDISVESQANLGTTFILSFKLADEKVPEQQQLSDKTLELFELEAKVPLDEYFCIKNLQAKLPFNDNLDSIVIIEDTAELLEYLALQLRHNFNVFVASDGVEGIDICQKVCPDIIVTDLNMPNMDGYKVLEKIKSDPLLGHIPVLLLTAVADIGAHRKGLLLGADDIISKPIKSKELLVRIQNKISSRNSLWEYFSIEKKITTKKQYNNDISTLKAIEEKNIDEWLQKIHNYVNENMSNKSKLKVTSLARHMGCSSTVLNTKLKQLIGREGVKSYMKEYRLIIAHKKLLTQDVGKLEIFAGEHGFSGDDFSRSYKAKFGVNPSETKNRLQMELD